MVFGFSFDSLKDYSFLPTFLKRNLQQKDGWAAWAGEITGMKWEVYSRSIKLLLGDTDVQLGPTDPGITNTFTFQAPMAARQARTK